MTKMTVNDLRDEQMRGRRVLLRVDFNVPLDDESRVTDDARVVAALPTIGLLRSKGARLVILSHLGRPKARADARYSLAPVARRLKALMPDATVTFVPTTTDNAAVETTQRLADGDVIVMENTRFLPGEESNDPRLAEELSRLGDLFVNDAFGAAHRAHASTEGVARLLRPAVAGLLMEKELAYLGGALSSPKRPFVAILGGAKISGKIDVIEHLLPQVDRLLIGGAMANTFFKAAGLATGASLVEDDRVVMARTLLKRAGRKIVLPEDGAVATSLVVGAAYRTVPCGQLRADEAMYDIGSTTTAAFAREIACAGTVLWNGPMGVFETPPFDRGTRGVAAALAEATRQGTTTIVGGGDSAAAVMAAGLAGAMSHVSTGGGASLEFLEGRELPGVAVLDDR
ncbi:MAG: phosphoglycerate kinase [Gemmatimonadaceae bacterium]